MSAAKFGTRRCRSSSRRWVRAAPAPSVRAAAAVLAACGAVRSGQRGSAFALAPLSEGGERQKLKKPNETKTRQKQNAPFAGSVQSRGARVAGGGGCGTARDAPTAGSPGEPRLLLPFAPDPDLETVPVAVPPRAASWSSDRRQHQVGTAPSAPPRPAGPAAAAAARLLQGPSRMSPRTSPRADPAPTPALPGRGAVLRLGNSAALHSLVTRDGGKRGRRPPRSPVLRGMSRPCPPAPPGPAVRAPSPSAPLATQGSWCSPTAPTGRPSPCGPATSSSTTAGSCTSARSAAPSARGPPSRCTGGPPRGRPWKASGRSSWAWVAAASWSCTAGGAAPGPSWTGRCIPAGAAAGPTCASRAAARRGCCRGRFDSHLRPGGGRRLSAFLAR